MEASWRKNYLRYRSFFLNMLAQYRERSDWRAYLEILLSLGTISVFSIFALKPTVLTIADLIKQIDEKKQTVQTMDNKIQNLSKAQILYDGERGNIEILENTVIPKNANVDIFARQIEGLSSKHQIETSNLNLGESAIVGSAKIQPAETPDPKTKSTASLNTGFSLTVKSGIDQYDLLKSYLSDFKNLRQPPKIERVGFSTNENFQEGTISISLSLTGQLPYLPD